MPETIPGNAPSADIDHLEEAAADQAFGGG
jgi:hypothetical protein